MAEEKQTNYDVIVVGAGPAGMTAALYASRANLSVLMLDRGIYGGNLNNTAAIENYPGFKTVQGPELAQDMYQGATQFGAQYAYGTVEKVELAGDLKQLTTDMGDVFTAKVFSSGIWEFLVKKNMAAAAYPTARYATAPFLRTST